ncbi:MAG TPA: hypothetical protein VJ653_03120 [Acidimicrobiales bacterium]|nr:hypothetical protein [Acidimicrobiales bacterium]
MSLVHSVFFWAQRVGRWILARRVGAYLLLAAAVVAGFNAVEGVTQANCRSVNETNATVRFILDSGLRLRSPSAPPISPDVRQAYVEAYRRLPHTNCGTRAKTYFDPPFPTSAP